MLKLKTLVVEDDISQAEITMNTLSENGYEVVLASTIQKALHLVETTKIDALIIDIFLGENENGIDLAEKVNNLEKDIPFLFLTSSKSKEVFEKAKLTKPFSYVIKPFNELEFLYMLEVVIGKYYEQPNAFEEEKNAVLNQNSIFIKKGNYLKKVYIQDIHYIEVDGNYSYIYCEQGKFTVQLALKKMKTILPAENFIQTHRKYIINIEKIEDIFLNDNLVLLKSQDKITISERFKPSLLKNINILK